MKARPIQDVPRVCLTIAEAAAAIGVSETTFKAHVLPSLRIVELGTQVRIVPVEELRAWAERNASLRTPR